MKKLLIKDKKLRSQIKKTYIKQFVFKSIFNNFNIFTLIRLKSFIALKNLSLKASRISISNRCVATKNKKRFNFLTFFSRHIFLKLIRNGLIAGLKKSSW